MVTLAHTHTRTQHTHTHTHTHTYVHIYVCTRLVFFSPSRIYNREVMDLLARQIRGSLDGLPVVSPVVIESIREFLKLCREQKVGASD